MEINKTKQEIFKEIRDQLSILKLNNPHLSVLEEEDDEIFASLEKRHAKFGELIELRIGIRGDLIKVCLLGNKLIADEFENYQKAFESFQEAEEKFFRD